MLAPVFHPAMKFASAPRKEVGIRTVFNILGPLTNPAGAEAQLLGVPGERSDRENGRGFENAGLSSMRW